MTKMIQNEVAQSRASAQGKPVVCAHARIVRDPVRPGVTKCTCKDCKQEWEEHQ